MLQPLPISASQNFRLQRARNRPPCPSCVTANCTLHTIGFIDIRLVAAANFQFS
jgi:hypothetical protein